MAEDLTDPGEAPGAHVPRAPEELDEPGLEAEVALRVEGARVAYLDEAALSRDFPWLAADAAASPGGRAGFWRSWLLDRAAVVSRAQAAQAIVNEPIRTAGEPRPAYRLPRGGRAFLVPIESPGAGAEGRAGLLSLKGVGVGPGRVPADSAYRNGLLPLELALQEVLFQRLAERVLDHAGIAALTLPLYGVIDLGFRCREREFGLRPAGVLVRRAHRRPRGGRDLPRFGSRAQRLGIEIELALRRYGLSTSAYKGCYVVRRSRAGEVTKHYFDFGVLIQADCPPSVPAQLWKRYGAFADDEDEGGDRAVRFVGINLQTTREEPGAPLQLLDFGLLRVAERFRAPLVSQVRDREGDWGGVVAPDGPHYVQPDPELVVAPRYGEHLPLEAHDPEELAYLFGPAPPAGVAATWGYPPKLWDLLCRWLAVEGGAERCTDEDAAAAIDRAVRLATRHLHGYEHGPRGASSALRQP